MKANIQELIESLPEPIITHIQHLERMRQDFVANVSHELRTPLTVIHGYLEMILEQDFTENTTQKKMFVQMYQQTVRMQNLIENLLLLSRLEGHEDDNLAERRIEIAPMLETIVNEAKELSGESHHQIRLMADPNLMLTGIEDELHSLFSNIIFNAVKYTPAKGRIDIAWYQENGQAYFKATDTGIGIAAEHIPRLTERFYRVDPARSRASGGTGLGLAIAKHVLIRHDASLTITSELGKGSVFICVFPIASTTPPV